MRIIFGVGHPKQVHVRKNIIRNLIEDGHEIKILTTDKDITLNLLDVYGIDYEVYGTYQKNMTSKAYGIINHTYEALAIARWFKPDIFIGGVPYLAYVSKIVGKPHITLTDTEHANLSYWLTYPFTDTVMTPSCFKRTINPKKHVAYNGYEELTYLHPNYFTPDPSVLDDVGLDKNDKFIILRFVAWSASHDVGQSGISNEMKIKYISELGEYYDIFISSESKLEKYLEKYKLKIAPEKFHSLLSYAQLYIGESGAISTEAGILGVPSIYVSSLVGTMGNFDELEKRYGLVYSFRDSKLALNKASKLLEDKNTKNKWQKNRERMLNEKIDVTKFMTEFIEGYPNSFYILQKKQRAY
ncbi:MAG: hypothetical protein C5S48_10115 [Candidatus Methanogaster sp.]|nr:MAG: hypothetical protein C5S48_10115 [ANME-2 cluster archaeon]